MARKTKKLNAHDFTKQIHSTRRTGTRFSDMTNHDEKAAKIEHKLCCTDCRYFLYGCSDYIGRYHKACNEFQWD